MNIRTSRHLQMFKSNRLGWWSLWIFFALFFITLFAEFIANDKPLLVHYKQSYYVPIFTSYPETTFGGTFETEADFRDPFIAGEIAANGFMIWPLIPYRYDTVNYNLPTPAPSPPTADNFLGTDDQGRDVLARIIYGFRISVLFGLVPTILSTLIGIIAGAIQGTVGGRIDLLFQRFMEIWGSLPQLFLIIILTSFIEPNFWWLLLVMLLFSWMSLVGVVRAECLKTRNLDYVKTARALGVKRHIILFRHILPNSLVAAVTFLPFLLNGAITTLTALDFLGFGLPPGSPSLGELLGQGKANLSAPWLGISGFVIIAIMLSLLIFIGAALRDALDPRKINKG